MNQIKILLIEDNQKLAKNIKTVLELEKYEVDHVIFGHKGMQKISIKDYDCIILDLHLPDIDGIDVCQKIRKKGIKTLILMLTARIDLDSKVEGLDSGADDYLTKPFIMDELLARIRALTRRTSADKQKIVRVNNLKINLTTKTINDTDKKCEIFLPPREFKILEFLLENRGNIKNAEEIYERVWGENINDLLSDSLKVHIAMIRKKLGKDIIKTIKGFGYIMTD